MLSSTGTERFPARETCSSSVPETSSSDVFTILMEFYCGAIVHRTANELNNNEYIVGAGSIGVVHCPELYCRFENKT